MGPMLCLPQLVRQLCPVELWGPGSFLHLPTTLGAPGSRRHHPHVKANARKVHSDQVKTWKVPSSCHMTLLPWSRWSDFVTLSHLHLATKEAG